MIQKSSWVRFYDKWILEAFKSLYINTVIELDVGIPWVFWEMDYFCT